LTFISYKFSNFKILRANALFSAISNTYQVLQFPSLKPSPFSAEPYVSIVLSPLVAIALTPAKLVSHLTTSNFTSISSCACTFSIPDLVSITKC